LLLVARSAPKATTKIRYKSPPISVADFHHHLPPPDLFGFRLPLKQA
jgi:hypothetical protein